MELYDFLADIKPAMAFLMANYYFAYAGLMEGLSIQTANAVIEKGRDQ